MVTSPTTDKLFPAMVKAQYEMQGAKKSAENPFFSSKYADLGSVMAATKDHLKANGLSIIQFPITEPGMCGVETVLIHESGQWASERCTLACAKQDPQAYGSAITYARRYGWQAVCGIPSEDDDANSATFSKQSPSNNNTADDQIRF